MESFIVRLRFNFSKKGEKMGRWIVLLVFLSVSVGVGFTYGVSPAIIDLL
ncbi:hypothetical protein LEP1GSC194_3111, partial [Leptospira alstonii serovar Sichuan str. 79601]